MRTMNAPAGTARRPSDAAVRTICLGVILAVPISMLIAAATRSEAALLLVALTLTAFWATSVWLKRRDARACGDAPREAGDSAAQG